MKTRNIFARNPETSILIANVGVNLHVMQKSCAENIVAHAKVNPKFNITKFKESTIFYISDLIETRVSMLWYSYYLVRDYSLDVNLIPRARKKDCPNGHKYRERLGVCSCNSYCSWDLCRTIVAPDDCLLGTNSEWKWDRDKNAWVAQIVEGVNDHLNFYTINITINIFPNIVLSLD